MGKSPEQTFLQKRYTDGRQAHEKILTSLIIREMQVKTAMRYHHTSWSEWPSLASPQITNAGECVEKREPSCTVGGNVNWYKHCGKQYGGTLENYIQNYHMTQQSHSSPYLWTKLSVKETHAPVCSLQHYSQQSRHGNNLNIH